MIFLLHFQQFLETFLYQKYCKKWPYLDKVSTNSSTHKIYIKCLIFPNFAKRKSLLTTWFFIAVVAFIIISKLAAIITDGTTLAISATLCLSTVTRSGTFTPTIPASPICTFGGCCCCCCCGSSTGSEL